MAARSRRHTRCRRRRPRSRCPPPGRHRCNVRDRPDRRGRSTCSCSRSDRRRIPPSIHRRTRRDRGCTARGRGGTRPRNSPRRPPSAHGYRRRPPRRRRRCTPGSRRSRALRDITLQCVKSRRRAPRAPADPARDDAGAGSRAQRATTARARGLVLPDRRPRTRGCRDGRRPRGRAGRAGRDASGSGRCA